jgi:hypothetical protein
MTVNGQPFGASSVRTILIPQDHQASAEFTASNSGADSSHYWTYRYYHWDPDAALKGWWRMGSYATDHWRGPGDAAGSNRQQVHADRLDPGLTGAARFWKAPVAGRVRVTGVVQDAAGVCSGGAGNGVSVRIRHHKAHDRKGVVLLDYILSPGGSVTFGPYEPMVDVNDTLRFIVKPRDGFCDRTIFDPLIQILEPSTGIGPSPTPQAVVTDDPELED